MPNNEPWASNLFTSESVSMGHPDKLADQISDAVLDSLMAQDPQVRAAVETLVTTNFAMVAGEVTVHNDEARAALDHIEQTVRNAIRRVGYDDPNSGFDYKTCEFVSRLHPQSPDIDRGVTAGQGLHHEQGAGDQGLMFGFACDETEELIPLPIFLSHRLVERLAEVRQSGEIGWLKPDAKSQVTVAYDGDTPTALHTIVLSTQHSDDVFDTKLNHLNRKAQQQLRTAIIEYVVQRECPKLWSDDVILHVNPTGRFVIGGPAGDCGLTGRKIIVDTYGGRGRHGGGAFSGKDPSKVDRSATYMARHIAKNIVAAGLARQCEVQLAYAIGVAEPVSVAVDTFGSSEISSANLVRIIRDKFPLKPAEIIEYLDLRRPIFFETARHGHFGRRGDGFTWEKTDREEELKKAAQLLQVA